jgi:hypothetical protein
MPKYEHRHVSHTSTGVLLTMQAASGLLSVVASMMGSCKTDKQHKIGQHVCCAAWNYDS